MTVSEKTMVDSALGERGGANSASDDELALGVDRDGLLADSPDPPACGGDHRVDAAVGKFPCCLVWSPIPVLTWFLPFIGHLGIADSDGVMYDFAGPYTIGRGDLAFGKPTRYLQCRVPRERFAQWDDAVAKGCALYETRMHNLCCDNCHSHVAVCLERFQYRGIKRWNMVMLCFWVFFCGTYVDARAVVKSWLPFAFVLALVAVVHSTA